MKRKFMVRRASLAHHFVRGNLVLFAIVLFVFSSKVVSSAELKTEKFTLDNGMTVLLNEIPTSTTVSIYALVKTGSATEGEYLGTGISHFVEHMLFKGTLKRGVGQISQEIRSLGGQINASTGFDYTIYTMELPQGTFEKALDVMADMLMNSAFNPDEVEKERAVIFGEMRLHNDNPDRRLSELVYQTVFVRHPYMHPIIGYETLFKNITEADLLEYYHTHYIPNNIVFSVAGKINSKEARKSIQTAFKDFTPGGYLPRNLPQEPNQLYARTNTQEYSTDLTRMSLSYQGVSIMDKDMVALDVLAMALGQGESSRLYLDVYKKKQLVHSITSGNYTPADKGIFEIESLLRQENIEQTLVEIKSQIDLIKKNGISSEELEKTKRQVLSEYLFDNQTSAEVAHSAAVNDALLNDPDFSKQYIKEIDLVKNEDIIHVANKYLNEKSSSVVILRPKKDESAEIKPDLIYQSPEIEKITLENGLRILVREDHRVPLVTIQVVLNGGTRQETELNNGISELTSRLWIKGTKSKSADQISSGVEKIGAMLDSFSGRNSYGFSLNLLSQNLDYGINLVEELIKAPTFPLNEFNQEKDLMKASILARDDNPTAVTSRNLKETLFLSHPYRLEALGTRESIERITREQVIEFYKRLSAPNNMVISVYGDINKEQVSAALNKKFSSLKNKEINLPIFSEAPPRQTREKKVALNKQQAIVMIGFQSPKMSDPERYGVEVIASLLGSSLNGRIFIKIRDELGQSYTLGGGFTPGIDTGMTVFFVATTKENAEKVKGLLIEQIQALHDTEISTEELVNTKSYIKGSYEMGLETNASLGFVTSLDELYGLGFDHYKKYPKEIDKVTKEDVKRLAKKYLDPKGSAIVIALPKDDLPAQRTGEKREAPIEQMPPDHLEH